MVKKNLLNLNLKPKLNLNIYIYIYIYIYIKTSLASYNKENYTHNELIYNALDKINQLNGLGADKIIQ